MNAEQQSLILEQCDSSNSYLLSLIQEQGDLPQLYSVIALGQSSGRGQRGSRWETSPGENLTFSFLIHSSGVPAREQYAISQFVAYGVLKTLARYLPEQDKKRLSIKWPNDIYYDHQKIAGILIEHNLSAGEIAYSVVGVGINLNQINFPDHLPNPISLRQITQQSYDIKEVHARLMKRFGFMLPALLMGNYSEVHQRSKAHIYRRYGLHPYRDKDGTFWAEIRDVLPTGELVLQRPDGQVRSYQFKEVSIVL